MKFKFVQIKEHAGPLQIGDNQKNAKLRWCHLNLLKNHRARKAQIYTTVFLI
jgi:hypothetical protein